MKRIIRLTESDLTRIVRRVINEQSAPHNVLFNCLTKNGWSKHSGSLDSEDKVVYFYEKRTGGYINCTESFDEFILKIPILGPLYSYLGLNQVRRTEGIHAAMECVRENGVIRCSVSGEKLTEEKLCNPLNITPHKSNVNKFTFFGNGVNMDCEDLTNKINNIFKSFK